MKSLSTEAMHALHLLAKRKNPDYIFKSEYQFISSMIFLKRNTSPCLICNVELSIDNKDPKEENDLIINHAIEHLREHNLIALL